MKVIEGKLQAKDLKFGIVLSRFNDFITSRLLDGAVDGLLRHGAAAVIKQRLADDHHPAEQREKDEDHQHRLGNRPRMEHDLQQIDLIASGCHQDHHAASVIK